MSYMRTFKPYDLGYSRICHFVWAKQKGMCYWCKNPIVEKEDTIASMSAPPIRYYHAECADAIFDLK